MKYILILLLAACAHHAPSKSLKYKRAHWPHWSDHDKNCRNTRQEILRARSIGPMSFDRKGCNVIRGKWEDYYYPQVHTLARNVDIDHLVPLKHAHDHGGAEWTREQKEKFANDPENLVITYNAYNREKGPKSIAEWLPVNRDYACKYVKQWMKIKEKYRLRVDEKEKNTVTMLNCPQ